MPKTKTFRVAVEGDTVDGRIIERSWLVDAAQTYNRDTYGARVNVEHIRGITADKPFKAYGDVLSLSTEEIELTLAGKKVKKLALNAEIEATDELVAMNTDKQKIYTSIEIQPNFANTGKAYLVGLAVTDSPASLGTEVLNFALKNPGAIRSGPQPQQPGNLFSLGLETSFELATGEVATPPADSSAGLLAAATAFFTKLTKGVGGETAPAEQVTPPAPPPAGERQRRAVRRDRRSHDDDGGGRDEVRRGNPPGCGQPPHRAGTAEGVDRDDRESAPAAPRPRHRWSRRDLQARRVLIRRPDQPRA